MRALVLVALLCVGTVHALDDTCSTLWSKLAPRLSSAGSAAAPTATTSCSR